MNDLTVETQHGSSGAILDIQKHFVRKTGDGAVGERVLAQAKWLDEHRSSVVPVIFDVMPNGYMMERLEEVEPFTLDIADLDAIIGRLSRGVWYHQAEIHLSETAHCEKMLGLEKKFASHEMKLFLWEFRETAFDDDQRRCLTHGDPTLDNVMRRSGYFVITDPIPATPAVPDLWAVDLGKILQSLTGFEYVRYGVTPHKSTEVRPGHLLDTLDWNDRIRTVYWCVVHYLRAMPYVDDTIHDKLRRCAENAISLIRR